MRMGGRRERIEVWRPGDLAGVELRRGFSVREPYPRHWHEEYQFCLIESGGGELFYRGTHHATPRASLFVVHPGEVHSNRTETGCSFRSIYVDPELVRDALSAAAGRAQSLPFFPDPLVFDAEIVAAYDALHRAAERPATALERESLLLDLLTRLAARHARERLRAQAVKRDHRAVRRARDYLVEHHARNVSLAELARVASLSPFHLTRLFARETGMPPHAFQTQLRVAAAKRLIRAGSPLSAVAACVGFADQSHLIRHFKRLTKITPGEYLKNSNNVQYSAAPQG
jgi:AraC-like DNA-binding protein